jgi:hypothetical protein
MQASRLPAINTNFTARRNFQLKTAVRYLDSFADKYN